MTGYLITADGVLWQLPELLEWQVTHTDGETCDCAQVEFVYAPAQLPALRRGFRLRLEEDGKTEFFGVVDEICARTGEKGSRGMLCARGLQALLMDNENRGLRFVRMTHGEALTRFVRPYDIPRVEAPEILPPVENFSLASGSTAWQALRGFCRHSAGIFPRFTADGTLLLTNRSPGTFTIGEQNGVIRGEFRLCRYGLATRHEIVSTADQSSEIAVNPEFLALGGCSSRVTLRQSRSLYADWRTARQRIEDELQHAVRLSLTLPGTQEAEPGDRVRVELPAMGIREEFVLCEVRRSLSQRGRETELVLKGGLV